MNILDLPDCVLDTIFSYLSFDDIAKYRIVSDINLHNCFELKISNFFQICKKVNDINMNLLNHGFYKLLNCHSKQLKIIKAQLPRRESERRNHPRKLNWQL